MDFIKDWVKDIFLIIAGLYFVEIVLPSSSMKKYVKFVFSIMILGVVIAPITTLTKENVSAFSGSVTGSGNREVAEEWDYDIKATQNMQIIEIYREKLKEEIKNALEQELPELAITDIQIYLYEDSKQKNYGKVKMVVIKGVPGEYQNSVRNLLSEKFGLKKEVQIEGKE